MHYAWTNYGSYSHLFTLGRIHLIHFFFNLNSPFRLFCQFTSKAEHFSCCSHIISIIWSFNTLEKLWNGLCYFEIPNCWKLHWPCGLCWMLCMHYALCTLLAIFWAYLNGSISGDGCRFGLVKSLCIKIQLNWLQMLKIDHHQLSKHHKHCKSWVSISDQWHLIIGFGLNWMSTLCSVSNSTRTRDSVRAFYCFRYETSKTWAPLNSFFHITSVIPPEKKLTSLKETEWHRKLQWLKAQ